MTFLLDLIADESRHFLLAYVLGFAAFWSMLTMLSVITLVLLALTHKTASMVVVYCILISAVLCGLAFVALSHLLLDSYSIWYITPLGPGLDLIH